MIIYFTGTGNSEHVARTMAEALQDELVDAREYLKEGKNMALASERPWVIVAPTYCWRLPRVLEALLRHSRFAGARHAYFVLTCGSDVGNAGHYLKKLCKSLSWNYMGVFPICMPENYIAMFDVPSEEQSRKLIRIGDKFAKRAVNKIQAGEKFQEIQVPVTGKLCSGPVNPMFYRLAVRDKAFYATDACIGCGKCVRDCVMNNIRLQAGKPQWQGNCTHCMACICGCPSQAIEYGKKSIGKRRYLCQDHTAD